jgi:hypothetical protein
MHKRLTVALLGATAVLALQFGSGPARADILSFGIGTRAELSVNNTVATLSGTVACNDFGQNATVTVEILQPSGRSLRIGLSAGNLATCSAGPEFWEAPVLLASGQTWKNGPADATVIITTPNDAVQQRVRLQLHK